MEPPHAKSFTLLQARRIHDLEHVVVRAARMYRSVLEGDCFWNLLWKVRDYAGVLMLAGAGRASRDEDQLFRSPRQEEPTMNAAVVAGGGPPRTSTPTDHSPPINIVSPGGLDTRRPSAATGGAPFRIFVYSDLSDTAWNYLRGSNCGFWTADVYLHGFFRHSPLRTTDSSKADFFLLPTADILTAFSAKPPLPGADVLQRAQLAAAQNMHGYDAVAELFADSGFGLGVFEEFYGLPVLGGRKGSEKLLHSEDTSSSGKIGADFDNETSYETTSATAATNISVGSTETGDGRGAAVLSTYGVKPSSGADLNFLLEGLNAAEAFLRQAHHWNASFSMLERLAQKDTFKKNEGRDHLLVLPSSSSWVWESAAVGSELGTVLQETMRKVRENAVLLVVEGRPVRERSIVVRNVARFVQLVYVVSISWPSTIRPLYGTRAARERETAREGGLRVVP